MYNSPWLRASSINGASVVVKPAVTAAGMRDSLSFLIILQKPPTSQWCSGEFSNRHKGSNAYAFNQSAVTLWLGVLYAFDDAGVTTGVIGIRAIPGGAFGGGGRRSGRRSRRQKSERWVDRDFREGRSAYTESGQGRGSGSGYS